MEGSRTRDHDHVINHVKAHVTDHVVDRVIDQVILTIMKCLAPLLHSFYISHLFIASILV